MAGPVGEDQRSGAAAVRPPEDERGALLATAPYAAIAR